MRGGKSSDRRFPRYLFYLFAISFSIVDSDRSTVPTHSSDARRHRRCRQPPALPDANKSHKGTSCAAARLGARKLPVTFSPSRRCHLFAGGQAGLQGLVLARGGAHAADTARHGRLGHAAQHRAPQACTSTARPGPRCQRVAASVLCSPRPPAGVRGEPCPGRAEACLRRQAAAGVARVRRGRPPAGASPGAPGLSAWPVARSCRCRRLVTQAAAGRSSLRVRAAGRNAGHLEPTNRLGP